jgi:hypothetical protein
MWAFSFPLILLTLTGNTGYADCNLNPLDGCEVDTRTTAGKCGSCTNDCNNPGAPSVNVAICSSSACLVQSCVSGFADCDGGYLNGCEIDLRNDPSNCGTCGSICSVTSASWPNVTGWGCANGACTITQCASGRYNCDGITTNGCESFIPCCTVPANCTGRNWFQVNTYSCIGGVCGILTCASHLICCLPLTSQATRTMTIAMAMS